MSITVPTVEKAVDALLKWKEVETQTKNPKLIPDDDFIYLILTLKKIPQKARTNPYRIPLPNPLHTPPSSEICLILDDRPVSKQAEQDGPVFKITKEDAKRIIKDKSVPVSKIIPLSKMKTNYKPHEAKRKLCDSYDLFLVHKSIVHFLPKLLGKHFFKKKKLPLPVDLSHHNWKEQVEKACSSALLYMRTGTCCVVKIGKLAMSKDEIVNNVMQGIEGVVNVVPKNWGGIRSLHLKFADSVALPLYQALPDTKLKIEGVKQVDELSESEGLVSGDEEGLKGKEGSNKRKKKGRIHEVRYMDEGIDGEDLMSEDEIEKIEENPVDELIVEENGGKKRKKTAMVKEVEEEEVKLVSKKGKKAEKVVKEKEDGKKVKEVEEEEVKLVSKKGKKAEKVEEVKEKKVVLEEESDEKKEKLVSKKGKKDEVVNVKKGKRKSEVEESVKVKEKRGRKRVAAA